MKTKKIYKKYKSSRRIIHFLIVIIVIVTWQVKVFANNEHNIDNIRKLWQEQKYEEVLPILLNYRENQPNDKDLEVDYMIATSACRSPEEWSFGRKVLSWIKYNYTLSQEKLNIIDEELDNCDETNTTSIRLVFREQYQIPTASVRGKEFLYLNNFPVNSKPLELKEEIPLKEFNSRLFKPEQREEAIISIKNRLGSSYKVVSTHSFVLASSNHPETKLENIGKNLERVLSFFVDEFDVAKPSHLITVYPIADVASINNLAVKVHGITLPNKSVGYYFDSDLSVVGETPLEGINLLYGTLTHELCHLVLHNSFGDIPSWMDEGIASMYEVSSITSDGLRGIPNWRGKILKRFWDLRPSIKELVRMDSFSFHNAQNNYEAKQQAINYATSRYFFLYLQEQGLLLPTFKAFHNRNIRDISSFPALDASKLLESVLEKPLEVVDREFVEWFNTLEH